MGSGAAECITTDGKADFAVPSSAISNATNGAPGGYPSVYQGCHFGVCTSGGLTATPVQVSSLTAGKVTTSWSTTQPGGSNDYDVAYDVWFNHTPATTGLDLAPLAQDAVSRGFLSSSCYLIDVEAGFEIWQGGAGLATNSFSVDVNGAAPVPPACTVSYSLGNSSNGSMQANVILTGTGNSPLNSWQLSWTFPGDTKITSMWAGVYTQSGAAVTVNNASYDGTIAAGASAEIGFDGTYSSNDAPPAGITCT